MILQSDEQLGYNKDEVPMLADSKKDSITKVKKSDYINRGPIVVVTTSSGFDLIVNDLGDL